MTPDLQIPIPREELARHERYLTTYRSGTEILSEGKSDDFSLYLLRVGSVGIYRNTNEGPKQIDTIEAVNFFGEMALITRSPRTATVKAISDTVYIYKFQSVDLKSVYANPMWVDKLITRLVNNLKQTTDRMVNMDDELTRARQQSSAAAARQEYTLTQDALIFSALDELQQKVAAGVVLTTREWHYLVAIREMVQAFVQARLPEVAAPMRARTASALDELRAANLLPERLKEFIGDRPQEPRPGDKTARAE